MGPHGASPEELATRLNSLLPSLGPDLTGPVHVISVSPAGGAALSCEFTAQQLVPVDPTDDDLARVFITAPIHGSVTFGEKGEVADHSLSTADTATIVEVRTFAADLLESGAVKGLSKARAPHPGTRPTHEIQTDAAGRRIIRRIGFASQ